MFSSSVQFLILISAAATGVLGHSWIDDLTVVGGSIPTGTKGYIRNYQGHYDDTSFYRIEDPSLNVAACAPFQQELNQYPNPQYPQLTAAPGDWVLGTYTENGHISKPPVPDSNLGQIFWYATTHNDLKPTLRQVIDWTADGKGGDGKGMLLVQPTSFDDGVCIEDNGTPEALKRKAANGGGPCKSSFKIPETTQSGSTLTVFWVWNFSGQFGPKKVGHTEWYTSCIDIKIGDKVTSNMTAKRGIKNTQSAKFRGRL
ncbi:hypothetical protein EDC01DRAFT_669051 [Geopyxis carbonaria]|nr:hypothetical protein EDC01DRAFT_669051 [Geopyxis carbonaria]